MAHGHLVVMGGICTVDPSVEDDGQVDPRGPVLTIEQYTKTKERGRLDRKLRKISEEYIKDRSKSDILSKLIAILQTTWFILQCIARAQQKLTLTELELVTLALASLNAIMYVFWWHKPLGIQVPIRIYFETEAVEKVDVEDADAEQGITIFYVLSGFVNEVGGILAGIREAFQEAFILFLFILPIMLVFLVLCFPRSWRCLPAENPQNKTSHTTRTRRLQTHRCSNRTHPSPAPLQIHVVHCPYFREVDKGVFQSYDYEGILRRLALRNPYSFRFSAHNHNPSSPLLHPPLPHFLYLYRCLRNHHNQYRYPQFLTRSFILLSNY